MDFIGNKSKTLVVEGHGLTDMEFDGPPDSYSDHGGCFPRDLDYVYYHNDEDDGTAIRISISPGESFYNNISSPISPLCSSSGSNLRPSTRFDVKR